MLLQSQSTSRQLQDRANKRSKEQTKPLTAIGRYYLSNMMTGMMNKIYFDAKVHISFILVLVQSCSCIILLKKKGLGRAGGWTNQKAYS